MSPTDLPATLNRLVNEPPDAEWQLRPLSSNRVFRARRGEYDFVVRFAREGPIADREREAANHRTAAEAGIAPELVHADPARGLFVTKTVAPARMLQGGPMRTADLEGAARVLAACHALTTFRGRTAPVAALAELIGSLGRAGRHQLPPSGVARLAGLAKALPLTADAEDVSVHGDAHRGNWLVGGGEYRLIDWEFSGRGSRAWDLVEVIVSGRLDRIARARLIDAYADASGVGASIAASVDRMEPLSDLLSAAWGWDRFLATGNVAWRRYGDRRLADAIRRAR